jgi:hypothetical protein
MPSLADAARPGRLTREHAAALGVSVSAQLQLSHFREKRVVALRRLAACAAPLWIHAWVPVLPAWLAWVVVLMTGFTLAEAIAFGTLEHMWLRRVYLLPAAPERFVPHLARGRWNEARSILLDTTAVLTIAPWLALASGRRLPQEILLPASIAWILLVLGLGGTELGSRRAATQAFPDSVAGPYTAYHPYPPA